MDSKHRIARVERSCIDCPDFPGGAAGAVAFHQPAHCSGGTAMKPHNGFALVTAILVLALVAAAIASLASSMSSDARRTLDRARDAQLEQLLLAGAADAGQHLKSAQVK